MEEMILIGIGGMMLFAIGIILFVLVHQRRVIRYQLDMQKMREEQQKQLLQAAIESEEKERRRIAGDLHDDIGGSLATVRLYLLQAARTRTRPQEDTEDPARDLLDEIIGKIRQLSRQLSPEMLTEFGLQGALNNLSKKADASGALSVEFRCEGAVPRLQPARELAAYRIIQELFNNILKHAGASRATLTLAEAGDALHIRLEDDGRGFGQEDFEQLKRSPAGLGLKNIQSRLHILHASIHFARGKNGAGTLLTIDIPQEAGDGEG